MLTTLPLGCLLALTQDTTSMRSSEKDGFRQEVRRWLSLTLDTDNTAVALNDSPIGDTEEPPSSLKTEVNEWLTTEEAADFLRTSIAVVRNLTSNGRLPYFKFGRSNRYSRGELRKLLLANPKGVRHGN